LRPESDFLQGLLPPSDPPSPPNYPLRSMLLSVPGVFFAPRVTKGSPAKIFDKHLLPPCLFVFSPAPPGFNTTSFSHLFLPSTFRLCTNWTFGFSSASKVFFFLLCPSPLGLPCVGNFPHGCSEFSLVHFFVFRTLFLSLLFNVFRREPATRFSKQRISRLFLKDFSCGAGMGPISTSSPPTGAGVRGRGHDVSWRVTLFPLFFPSEKRFPSFRA